MMSLIRVGRGFKIAPKKERYRVGQGRALFICNHFFYGFNQTMISLLDFFNHDFKTMVLWYYCKFRTAIVTLKIPVMGIHYCDFLWGILMGKSYGEILWGNLMGISYGAFLLWFQMDWTGLGWAGLSWAGLSWAGLGRAGLGHAGPCWAGQGCHGLSKYSWKSP